MSFVYLYLLIGTVIMPLGVLRKVLEGCKGPFWMQLAAAIIVVLVWPIAFFVEQK